MSTPTIEKKQRVVKKIRLSLLRKWLVDNNKVASVFDLTPIPEKDGEIDFKAIRDDRQFDGLKRADLKAPKPQWGGILDYGLGTSKIVQQGGQYASLFSMPYLVERLCQEVLGPRYERTLVEWISENPELDYERESTDGVDQADLGDVDEIPV
jgi:hypothetical protein